MSSTNRRMSLTSHRADLMTWLSKRRYWISKKVALAKGTSLSWYSHLSMDGARGGRLAVAEVDNAIFYQKYAAGIAKNMSFYLSENRTPVFRMFIDGDFPPIDFSPAERCRFEMEVMKVMQSFYPDVLHDSKTFIMVVCGIQDEKNPQIKAIGDDDLSDHLMLNPTSPKDVVCCEEDAKENTPAKKPKSTANVHLHFPNLYVTAERAAVIARTIALVLEQTWPRDDLNWNDVVDSCVYVSTGLRMVGSRKCKMCSECNGKGCCECGMVGRFDLGRVYRADAAFIGTTPHPKFLKVIKRSVINEVLACTIRNYDNRQPTDGWAKPHDMPGVDMSALNKFAEDVSSTLKLSGDVIHKLTKLKRPRSSSDVAPKQVANSTMVPKGSAIYTHCQELIRSYHPNFVKVSISKMYKMDSKNIFTVFVDGPGANYCLNLLPPKKSHGGRNVYFVISEYGVRQKCTCKHLVERKNGCMCKDFKSAQRPLTYVDKKLLFGVALPSNPTTSMFCRAPKKRKKNRFD